MRITKASVAALLVGGGLFLQGCGSGGDSGGGGDNPGPTPDPGPTPSPSPPSPSPSPSPDVVPRQGDWKSNPIKVKGQHLYDAVTDEPFRIKGIGFPNAGLEDSDVQEWIDVLERIKELGPSINVIRLYELPTCTHEAGNQCFLPFMRRADELGVYVLIPGTGTQYGFLPIRPAEFDNDPQKCYEQGGVLGFGQTAIANFNYPNVLAIVIGNEFDQQPQMREYLGVIKAYARDLKAYMNTCNTDDESATKGQMRNIPLMYACSDDSGDAGVEPKADYLFCDEADAAVDMFGLNVERFCDDRLGPAEYQRIMDWLEPKKYPGSFWFSEEGCHNLNYPDHARSWAQIQGFFENYNVVDGFAAYTYCGNPDFDMFTCGTGKDSEAPETQDGQNFFSKLEQVGSQDISTNQDPGTVPQCPTSILGKDLHDYKEIKWYDTGAAGWATSCPTPYGDVSKTSSIEV